MLGAYCSPSAVLSTRLVLTQRLLNEYAKWLLLLLVNSNIICTYLTRVTLLIILPSLKSGGESRVASLLH